MHRILGASALLAVALVALCSGAAVAREDTPGEAWNETYGDGRADEAAALDTVADGGYVLAGYTTTPRDGRNAQLVRTSADGSVEWTANYGDGTAQRALDVVSTAEGYVLTGVTTTADGTTDAWLAKADTSGTLQWRRSYGSDADDRAVSLVTTESGGYALAGWTNATGPTDGWLLRVASDGTLRWEQRYGGTAIQNWQAVVQTADGGFALAGWTSAGSGGDDALLLRTDADGTEQWRRSYGGSGDGGVYRHGLVQTNDGGFAMAGWTDSYGDDSDDMWLLRTDGDGTERWNQTYDRGRTDVATSIVQSGRGFAVSGYTRTADDGYDAWIVETDGDGVERWNVTAGGSATDAAMDLVQTDGGVTAAGYTGPYGAGSYDAWLVRAAGPGDQPEPPSIDPESYDIGPYPVETGIPPTILIEASNADSVRVEATVDGETGSVQMTNVSGNKLWEADLGDVSDLDLDGLGPGTRVGLRIVAENDQTDESAVLSETTAAYPDSQLPTSGEPSKLHYYTFKNVIDLPVVLAQFADTSDAEIPYDDLQTLTDWQEAQEHDVNTYYGQGALGAVGFDFRYYDNGSEFFDLGPRSEYDRRSLVETANTLPDADIDGPYVVTIPGDTGDTFDRAVAYPDLRGSFAAMDSDVAGYGTWSHELGHAAVGVDDLYAETTCTQYIVEVCYENVEGGIGRAGLMGTAVGIPGAELPEEFSVLSMTDINTLSSVSGPAHPWLETEEVDAGSAPWSETFTVESIEAKRLGDSVPVVDTGITTDTGVRKFAFQADDSGFGPVVDVFELGIRNQPFGGSELELATNVGPIDADPGTIDERFVERPLGAYSPLVANISIADTNGETGKAYEADVTVEIDTGEANTNTMRLDPNIAVSGTPQLGAPTTNTTPDVDLIATDSQGRRVGPTDGGGYVVEIPGASASGDTDGLEWISVPDDANVSFSVRTDGVETFLNETGIDSENVTVGYETGVTHYGEDPTVVTRNGTVTVVNATTERGTNGTVASDETVSALRDSVVAGFSGVPYRPRPGEPVSLDGGLSTVLEGDTDAYEWDLDDDGEFEVTGSRVETTFETAGRYDVTLRTTSSNGVTDTETNTIQVGDPVAFTVTALEGPTGATAGNVTINATLSNTGDFSGTAAVEVRVDNRTVTTTTVSLDANETARLGTTVDIGPGSHTVSVHTPSETVRSQLTTDPPAGPTVPTGVGPATDPDGDGLLEDVTGDGAANLFDAIAYYNAADSEAVESHPEMFDFDGRGPVGTLFDAIALYNEIAPN